MFEIGGEYGDRNGDMWIIKSGPYTIGMYRVYVAMRRRDAHCVPLALREGGHMMSVFEGPDQVTLYDHLTPLRVKIYGVDG